MTKRWMMLTVPAILMTGASLYAEEVTERATTVDQDNAVGANHDKMGADTIDTVNKTLSKTFNSPIANQRPLLESATVCRPRKRTASFHGSEVVTT